jgi:hypothetical protein
LVKSIFEEAKRGNRLLTEPEILDIVRAHAPRTASA